MDKEAKERIEEVRKKLVLLESEFAKAGVRVDKKDVEREFDNVLGILDNMLKEDAKEYIDVKTEKVGNLKVEKGLRIKFLD